MALELWLNFKDEKGKDQRVLVDGEKFAIGRTPDNDLQIPLSNLSRQHAQIQRFADVFVVSDCGSSNGTTLNEEPLEKPAALKNGDKLNLGDAVEIEIEFVSDKPSAADESKSNGAASDTDDKGGAGAVDNNSGSAKSISNSSASDKGSIPFAFFILAPILGVFVLLVIGGIFLLASNRDGTEIVKNENISYSTPEEDVEPTNNNTNKTPEKNETPTITPTGSTNTAENMTSTPIPVTPEPTEEMPETPKTSDETKKTFKSSLLFLRRIALNDQRAFLTDKQIAILNGKINSFKGSGALADNIKNAKKNQSQIETMARSKNLRPQFLANAALTKLGNQRGDVVATAQGMLEVLDNLSIQIGNEFSNDNLLVIAAYEQGVAGENLKMRDMLARLTTEFPRVSSTTIRTIWFLKENGKITDSQFEFALRFLAIGTITQNPKDFNVQAEALTF